MKNSGPLSLYRCSHWLYRHRLKHVSKFLDWTNRLLFACWCPGSATIGKGTRLGYWGAGTVIHSNTVLGKNCMVGQGVTIGRNFGDTKVPVIGDDVYIGAGSKVFGEIMIGNNVIIGANSVVNKSVPDNCTVAGNPFRILKENRKEKYYEIDKIVKRKDMETKNYQEIKTAWGG